MLHSIETFLESTLGSFPVILSVRSIAIILKMIFFIFLLRHKSNTSIARKSTNFLLLVLLGGMVEDFAWVVKLVYHLFFNQCSYQFVLCISRIAWGFTIIQYQALSLFIECLIQKPFKLSMRHLFFIGISSIFILLFFGIAIIHFNRFEPNQRSSIEFAILRCAALYMLIPLMLSCIFHTVHRLKQQKIPRILHKQFSIFLKAVIAPYLISDFIQTCPSNLSSSWICHWITNSYAVISISSIFLTYAIFYCARKMIGLRFLNMSKHVKSPIQINFINNFKDVFEDLNNALNIKELAHTTQTLFKNEFHVPANRVSLHLYSFGAHNTDNYNHEDVDVEKKVELILSSDKSELSTYLKKSKILIYDELDFNNFYDEQQSTTAILQFLESINAEVFLPIFKHQNIIGYIIIEQQARPHQFYSNVERDEMVVIASYLSTILNLMKTRNLDTIIAKEKEMREELYRKHQEINQYKESIRSFLRHSKQREIGILFYKNRQFSFENKIAKDLVGVNPNLQEGDVLVKTLRRLAREVETYKSYQTCFSHDLHGHKLVLQAIPNFEQNAIIILVYYPEVSDLLARQIEMLKDPSEWDYMLYLETTTSGRLINQLIPGSGEKLLEFKISLLKTALHSKATLLQLPQEDLKPTVELLHHIRLRNTLHILNLQALETSMEIAIKLFGINPIFGIQSKEEPILKKLDGNGTLFIQNIHFLNLETQEYLAELIHFGFYRVFKTEQRFPCDVSIICSTNQDLDTLVQNGSFSKNLYAELIQTQLVMPSLVTLPEEELSELATGYSEQTLKQQAFKNFLELTEHDRKRLSHNRPSSLQELKTKVHQLIIQKSRKNQIYDETLFDPAYQVSDPELIEAARLGKQALKDPGIMAMLWNKFKNQNKIAAFLGVNRSSVNRRCREYNLM